MSDPQSGFGYPSEKPVRNPPQNPYGSPEQNPYGSPSPQNPYAPGPQSSPGAPQQQQPYPQQQHPQRPAGPQPWSPAPAPGYYPASAPRRRGLSTGGVLAIVLGSVGLVVIAGVVLVAVVIVGVIRGETARPVYPSAAPTSPSSGAYDLVDRPAFTAYVTRVTQLRDTYLQARRDGSIHQWVPATTTGDDYASAFIYLLTDKKAATNFMLRGTTTDDDPAVLDAKVAAWDAELTELERKFLAGEPFGVNITIKRSDGTTFHYDGAAGPNG
ncbi:hypothetical protein [Schumannella soli]|uniref:Uncharacterized protein n=1 Tax=Schumannella soli TaxID=2590779 RepID=A0A506XRT9_9MICO|nr:hypothetical protein [Schumannella soli]TPW75444.1 hypothetical protein FJ657_05980 [Schumannella soli]